MKKIISLLFAAVMLMSLVSCDKENKDLIVPEEKFDSYKPLFTITSFPGKTENTRFFPLEKGFLYVSQTEEGMKASYVDVTSSVSVEGILSETGFSSIGELVFFPGEDHSLLATDKNFYIVSPDAEKEKARIFDKRDFPENFSENYSLYDEVAFVRADGESGLVLLEPIDFSEKYVLLPLSGVKSCEYAVACGEKYLYFTKKTESGFEKLLRLTYGKDRGSFLFEEEFETYKLLGNSNILTKNKNDYRLIDIDSGECTKYQVVRDYIDFSASGDLKYFAGLYEDDGKEYIEIIDTDQSLVIKKVCLDKYKCGGDIEISGDGKTLVFSVLSGESDSAEMISCIQIAE